MFCLVGLMDRENILAIDKRTKLKLIKEFGTSDEMIRKKLSWMRKKGYAILKSSGVYFINPHIFTKASKGEVFKLQAEYKDLLYQQQRNKETKKKAKKAKEMITLEEMEDLEKQIKNILDDKN